MIRFAWTGLTALTLGLGLAPMEIRSQTLKHRFLAVDNGLNKLLLVDEITDKGWSVSIPAGSRDLQLLPGNKVLVSHGDGAAEYDLATGAKGWSVSGYAGVSSARRLANGNTMLGASDANAVTIYEISADKIQQAKHVASGLTDLRLARPLDNGNYLLGLAAAHKLAEINPAGSVVWSAALTDKGYVAYRLPNGHTIATSGEDCRIYDVSVDGKSTTLLAGSLEKHPAAGLLWFSGFEILPNGHFFVANWNGHGKEGQGPHAVEFDAADNLVWKWEDHKAASTVTNILTFETGTTGLGSHAEGHFRDLAAAGPHVLGGNIVFGKTWPAESVSGGSRFLSGSTRFLADGRLLPQCTPQCPQERLPARLVAESQAQVLRR